TTGRKVSARGATTIEENRIAPARDAHTAGTSRIETSTRVRVEPSFGFCGAGCQRSEPGKKRRLNRRPRATRRGAWTSPLRSRSLGSPNEPNQRTPEATGNEKAGWSSARTLPGWAGDSSTCARSKRQRRVWRHRATGQERRENRRHPSHALRRPGHTQL